MGFEWLLLLLLISGAGGIAIGGTIASFIGYTLLIILLTMIWEYKTTILICICSIITILFIISRFRKHYMAEHSKKHLKNCVCTHNPKIDKLAKIYIDNNIKTTDDVLSPDDYSNFNNIVQTENKITIENNYSTEVPYPLREALYSAYINKIKELKNGQE